nr:MAG TPA: hypothetical protein [Caudoviricetes sp.]
MAELCDQSEEGWRTDSELSWLAITEDISVIWF